MLLNKFISEILIITAIFFVCIKVLFVYNKVQSNSRNSRIDCYPEPGVSQQRCLDRGCLYDTNPGYDPVILFILPVYLTSYNQLIWFLYTVAEKKYGDTYEKLKI
jgi:hypothetical protein